MPSDEKPSPFRLEGHLSLRLPDGSTLVARVEPEEQTGDVPRTPVTPLTPPENAALEYSDRPTHSPDFACVRWVDGVIYHFGAKQRTVVALLWQAMLDGSPDVGGQYLLVEAESEQERISSLFKRNPAYGIVIVKSTEHGGPAGCFRIAPH